MERGSFFPTIRNERLLLSASGHYMKGYSWHYILMLQTVEGKKQFLALLEFLQ